MILSSNVSGKLSWRGALTIAFLAVIALPHWSLAQSSNPEQNQAPIAKSHTEKGTPKGVEPKPDASAHGFWGHRQEFVFPCLMNNGEQ